jgi:hypothetical protein
MNLSTHDIDAIAHKTAMILLTKLLKEKDKHYPDLVTTMEAAEILHITPARMRQIKNQYPYEKRGEGKQAKLLFKRDALYLSPKCK